MTCNNPKLDLVNMNAYIKFGENMSSSSQDIENQKCDYAEEAYAGVMIPMCLPCFAGDTIMEMATDLLMH